MNNKVVFEGLVTDNKEEYTEYEKNKIAFLNENYNMFSTQENYFRVFKNYIVDFEKAYKKDVSMFKTEEISELLNSITTSSLRLKKTVRSLLDLYISWCISRGMTVTTTNVMNSIDTDEVEVINMKKVKNKYFDDNRMKNFMIESEIQGVNAQFSVPVLLAYVGLAGEGFNEITNLSIDDIDRDNNIINIINKETGEITKSILVEDWVLNYIDKAANTKQYETTKKSINFEVTDLVIKPIVSNNNESESVSYGVLRKRITKALNDCGIRGVSLNDFFKNAMINTILGIAKEKGFLMNADFINTYEFYTGKSNSSYYALKKDFELLFPEIEVFAEKSRSRSFRVT